MAPKISRMLCVALAAWLLQFSVLSAALELITTNAPNTNRLASGFSGAGEISGDGRFILFQSTASDIVSPATPGGFVNLFMLDRTAGSLSLVSPNVQGTAGADAACVNPVMSADGRFVVFQSAASNLVTNDVDGVSDIFLRDRVAGTTIRVSAPYRVLAQPRRPSSNPTISADGERIVFQSLANDVAPVTTGARIPLFYLYERNDGTNRGYFSIDLGQVSSTNVTMNPVLSKNGTRVFFEAYAPNLINGQPTYGTHVYACDLASGRIDMVSADVMSILGRASTTPGNSLLRGVSANGNVAVFLTADVPSTSSAFIKTNYLFRHQVAEQITEIIATNINQSADAIGLFGDVAMSDDGELVVYGIGGNLYRWGATTKARELVTVGVNGIAVTATNVSAAFMTPDARFVAFVSPATNLVEGEPPPIPQLYRRDMATQTTVRISAAANVPFTTSAIYDGSMSDDGKTIVFTMNNPDFFGEDLYGRVDCVVWDEGSATSPQMVSKTADGLEGAPGYRFLSISTQPMSRDGKRVVFAGQAASGGEFPQVWLRDRTQGVTTLVSAGGSEYSQNAMISGDGRWVAFETVSSNLVAGATDTNRTTDVILHDTTTGVNRLVSKMATADTAPRLASQLKAMSLDGRYLAISSGNPTLTEPPSTVDGTGNPQAIFLWDRETGIFQLITKRAIFTAGLGAHTNIIFSPDSKRLALIAGGRIGYQDARTGQQVDATTATTVLIHEVESGVTKGYANSAGPSAVLRFSADGSKLLTTAFATSLRTVWQIDLATGAESPFTVTSEGGVTEIDSSLASGAWVVHLEKMPTPRIDLLQFSATVTNRLMVTDDKSARRPQISPNGDLLVYESFTALTDLGDAEVYPNPVLFDAARRTLAPLAAGNGSSVAHVLSADGGTVLVLSQASDLFGSDLNDVMDLFALPVSAAAKLSLLLTANGIDLRWPAAKDGYVLETATSVDAPTAEWQRVSTGINVDGDFMSAHIVTSDAVRFFRLRK